MELNTIETEQLYKQHLGLMNKEIYARRILNSNLDMDDMRSNANLAFTDAIKDWEPEKGKFSTILYYHLQHRLNRSAYIKEHPDTKVMHEGEKTKGERLLNVEDTMACTEKVDGFRTIAFMEELNDLHPRAIEIVQLILHPTEDFKKKLPHVTMMNLAKYLVNDLGWFYNEAKESIRDLQHYFSGNGKRRMKRMKKKTFRGVFNWHGEEHVLYTNCLNEERALDNFCVQLAKKLGQTIWSVRSYFANADRYGIYAEKEEES